MTTNAKQYPSYTGPAAGLPTTAQPGTHYTITDAASSTDCTSVGGGSATAECVFLGGVWSPTASGGGGSSLLTPNQVGGLKLWLKSDAGVYKDAGVTLAANGDTVQQWNDQSGNNNHASQPTAGKRATYNTAVLNSLPALTFSGGQCYQTPSISLTSVSAVAVFSATVNGIIYEQSSDANGSPGSSIYTSQTTYLVSRTNAGLKISGRNMPSSWGSAGEWLTAAHVFTGAHADHHCFAGGAWQTLPTGTAGNDPGIAAANDIVNVGARNNAASFAVTGKIVELFIHSPAPSMPQMKGLLAYVSAKWNLP